MTHPKATLLICLFTIAARADDTLQFSRDIRPLLSDNCFACHGPDANQRQANLRLDQRDGALAELDGRRAIVPGKPAESELVRRLLTSDESERMPPKSTGKSLSPKQVELLKRWIAAGAEYQPHWAFTPAKRPELPAVKRGDWLRNPIDRFVLARLEQEGLEPAAEAERTTLIRRVSLDLTGLPPTIAEVDAFLADREPGAYERVVDRLLKSPRHAERMALQWLDAARYADTNGYNNDEERTQWRWRDWVIEAFDRNLPFDQFVVQQLAGDLLPNATVEQRLATGFNRNHVLTTEGGIIAEEYRVEYVADRVHTTATVFLGLSLQCARCHEHKFDPLSQHDYYRFFAYFNNIQDSIVGYNSARVADPLLKLPTTTQQAELNRLANRKAELETRAKQREAEADAGLAKWEQSLSAEDRRKLPSPEVALHLPLDEPTGSQAADPTDSARGAKVVGKANWQPGQLAGAFEFDGQTHLDGGQAGAFDSGEKFSFAAWVRPTTGNAVCVLSKMDDANAYRGYDLNIEAGKVASHLVHRWPDDAIKVTTRNAMSLNEWHHVVLTYDGSRKAAGVRIFVDGQSQPLDVNADKLAGTLHTDKPFHVGKRHASIGFVGRIDDVRLFRTQLAESDIGPLSKGETPASLAKLFDVPPAERTPAQREQLRRHYLQQVDGEFREAQRELAEITKQQAAMEKSFVATMVMAEMPNRRETFVLKRGQYDQRGEQVRPGVPEFLAPLPAGAPESRLGLAQWLVQPSHPLTARVAVNRWWEQYFGAGLVETTEDFGLQGAAPSHPELLDWLATELVSSGWNVKAMQRLIVTSAAYRQSSRVTREGLERDPKNRLLARGARFRLPAEAVRDNALAVAGLLRDRLGGASVRPYQPAGLWEDVSVERRVKYVADQGDDLYRRSLYTFWKRTCPPPSLSTFDAPDRETCVIRRARTNTPLQALILMNDPTYVEAARKLAERIVRDAGPTFAERLAHGFRLVLARAPTAREQQLLATVYETSSARYRADKASAIKLLSVGESPREKQLDEAEVAAWTALASLLLNLDEAISRT